MTVAPPRGERGLKCSIHFVTEALIKCRSPSWGAWIEMQLAQCKRFGVGQSLPLVGSVD